MKAVIQEKLQRIRTALTKDCLVFVRVGPREYGITGVRQLAHNLEFDLAGDRMTLIVEPDEIGAVRILSIEA